MTPLAGTLGTSESMFPGLLKAITPDPDEMADAYQRMQVDRRAVFDGYHVEVFDMHSADGRRRYERLMVSLNEKAQARTATVIVHDRKMLPRKDGSSGWFNYIEWAEFRLDERNLLDDGKKARTTGK